VPRKDKKDLLFACLLPIINQSGRKMKKVVAIVGMAGSGKSEVSRVFESHGFVRIRFGDITDEEMKKRGLEMHEPNERYCRELLRKEYGMAAYAILNQPRIDAALQNSDVVADGLYSWEEYLSFRNYYRQRFHVIAVYASPHTRYSRLVRRIHALNWEEAAAGDKSEIENQQGRPIAMADFTIVNESTAEELRRQAEVILAELNKI
jgi:dephospho-CoA kinase